MTTKVYRANATFEDDWIMIRIPELALITQAEAPGEIERTARDIIALELDIDIDEVQVEVHTDATVHRMANQSHAERLKPEIDQLGDRDAE